MPPAVRSLAAKVMAWRGEHRLQVLLENVREKPVAELWRLTAQRTELRVRALEAWSRAGIDAVLGPVHTTPALRHGDSADFSLGGLPSMLFNFLNLPAVAVPVTRVTPEEAPRANGDRLERRARAVEEGSAGLPVGVQIAARPWSEEVALALGVLVEDGARRGAGFPVTPI
jgi:Asp-tRNA(Asn)/Glu-tRNA(Gln) amidotransferase A subunit family amidase